MPFNKPDITQLSAFGKHGGGCLLSSDEASAAV